MNLLRKNINCGVKGTLVGLFIVCLIYGLSVRVGVEQSFIQHCLTIISDHYYLLYFMLPLFLLLCFFVIEDDSEAVILRYKTYFRYFVHKWLSLAVISFIFITVQLLAIVISGIGLPMDSGWMIANGGTTQELFTILSSYFASPALGFTAITLYMFLGLCVTAMIFMWIGHFLSKSWAIKTMLILYVLSVMNIKIAFLQGLPITVLNHIINGVAHWHRYAYSTRLICWYEIIRYMGAGSFYYNDILFDRANNGRIHWTYRDESYMYCSDRILTVWIIEPVEN